MVTKKRAGRVGEQPMLDGMEPTPRELGFRGPQVCSIVGITYRQLDYWARTDLVRPSITDAKGSGTQRTYSFQDLVRLKVVKSLLDAGKTETTDDNDRKVEVNTVRFGVSTNK